MTREKLPDRFEKKYKSQPLKEKIADLGMWELIPSVRGSMDSIEGIRRLEANDLLFSFIDNYFPDDPFAFEPNMRDGRFVFLPDNVCHQGMGICVSNNLPGFLEVGHFWYPCEYTEKAIDIGPNQIYVPIFSTRPGDELAQMVRRVYINEEKKKRPFCTFPFEMNLTVYLSSYFLDDVNRAEKIIRKKLNGCSIQTKRNGEGLIQFMHHIMGR